MPEAFIPIDVCYDGPVSPVAIRSCLGYSVFGRMGKEIEAQCSTACTSAVHNLSDIRIPRCFIVTKIPRESIELHMFSDASEVAYSASAYIRITDDQATRLQEIHEHTKFDQWRFVPGKLNPADDRSRGLPIEVFKAKCRWLSGPDFLHQSVDQWPCTTITKVLEDGEGDLTKQSCQNVVAVGNGLSELLKRFSSWSKLQK
ncbi:Hypothetical predicted protein [Paramuricea clavata]|uniref:Uncharacterized protein n=1 Tax=Paramuricea clavata TaxID=317549 RepID=A0A6S7H232_PARCT|nr:Hypothetical predicted protein [Paramuricea clavata]